MVAVKYPEETKKYNIISFNDSAEAAIWGEAETSINRKLLRDHQSTGAF